MIRLLLATLLAMSTFAAANAADLKNDDAAKKAIEWVRDNLAQGNEREAEINDFTFDPQTGATHMNITIRNRQVSGKVPFTNKPIVAYDYSLNASVDFNVRGGNGNFEFDFGRGFKLRSKDLLPKIENIVK